MYSPLGHGPRSGRLNDLMVMIPAHLRQRPRRHDYYEDDLRSDDADGFSDDDLSTDIRGMRRHDSRCLRGFQCLSFMLLKGCISIQ